MRHVMMAVAACAVALLTDGCSDRSETEIIWLCDKAAGQSLALFPDADSALVAGLGLVDEVPSSMSAFLVHKDGKWLLFDTGPGLPDGGIRRGLDSLGLSPADIDYLFITHFHGDHIGGMLDASGAPVYTGAQVYASQAEYDAWMAMPAEANAQAVRTMEAYRDRLHMFAFGDMLPCGVEAIDAVGHTPGHTAFQVENILIWGDVIHGLSLQIDHPEICATYDMDPQTSIATRKRMIQYARDNGLLVAGMHLPSGFLDFRTDIKNFIEVFWQSITTEDTILFNFISFLASFVTIGGVLSLGYYFLRKKVSKECQKKILLDLIRHIFVNCSIVEIVRIKIQRAGVFMRPVDGVFQRFTFLDNDMDLGRFSVTSRNFEKIHSACLSMRNYNISADVAEKYLTMSDIPLKMRIRNLDEVFDRGVKVTKKLIELGKGMGFNIDVKMISFMFQSDFESKISGIYDKDIFYGEILPRNNFKNHSYYDEAGLTDLMNRNIIARASTVGFVPMSNNKTSKVLTQPD